MAKPSPSREAAVRAAFAQQSNACAELGSPFMGRLMALLAERPWPSGAVTDAVLGWPGDPAISADSPALRLAGGLHRLVLEGDEGLRAVYPPHAPDDDTLWAGIAEAIVRDEAALLATLTRAPQTNEVRRAVAILPALALVAAKTALPLALWEIGCAAGLNLRADAFHLEVGQAHFGTPGSPVHLRPEWRGPCPHPAKLRVIERRGVDLAPVEIGTAEGEVRLLSYLWPDQPERRALTEGALSLAAQLPARIDTDDAVTWLERNLHNRRSETATVLFHTVAWQYLPPDARAQGEALIAEAGAAASERTPLFRIAMEADGEKRAALSLTTYPDSTRHALARVDFHGRSVDWAGPPRL